MYVTLSNSIDLNDKDQPNYNSYVYNEYQLRKEAKQILTSQIVNMSINFSRTGSIEEIEQFVNHMSSELPKKPEPTYYQQAIEDAKYLIEEYFMDEIIQKLIDENEVSDDINNDYKDGDSIFHETIVDQYYSPKEAIELLSNLSEYEETDSGLWEGEDWEQILATKSAYTYGNAVYSEWEDIIDQINEIDIVDVAEEILNEKEGCTVIEDIDIVDYVEEKYEDELKIKIQEKIEELI